MNDIKSGIPSAREIFTAALGLEDAIKRQGYLDGVCRDDPALRQKVERLLAAQRDGVGSPLDIMVAAFGPEQTMAPTELMGTAQDISHPRDIGPYKLLEQIGQGGFGTVYMAEQTVPIRRKVALKILKPGMDSREVIARFEAERQALAMMDHPHISRVLDGGTTAEGRPYFVMELVRGIPLTEYCDEARLTTGERLELFIDICRAVQHAHQKGIIHRDLKPSNVMVTMHDDKAMVKVIDFGIAKALSQSLTDRTLFTGFQQMLGTPLYMSPEQAQMSGIDIDTRSDVYSLGVMLYELLTGTTPFSKESLSNAGFDELRRIIREQEPPRPSMRLSTLDANARSTMADRRRIDQRKVSQELRGELDWIVMKALEKDRNRRYESASAFAQDIQRYLDDEPVLACPPSVAYRLRKYAKRHKGLLTTAALLTATLFVATGVSIAYAFQAHQAKNDADQQKVAALAAKQLANQRLAQSRLDFDRALKALDTVVQELSSAEFAQIPGVAKTRSDILQRMLTLYEEIAKEHGDDPYARQQQALAYGGISDILNLTGQNEEAEATVNQGIAILEELLKADPNDREHKLRLAELLFKRFHLSIRSQAENLADAERALLLWQELVESGGNDHIGALGLASYKVAALLPEDSPRAAELIAESIRVPEEHGLTPHPASYEWLAARAKKTGGFAEAEVNYRRAIEGYQVSADLGDRVSRGLVSHNCSMLAKLLNSQGRFDEAKAFHLQSIDIARQLYEEYGKIPVYEETFRWRVRTYLTDAATKQQKEEALKLFDELIARSPEAGNFHRMRAEYLAELDDAIAALSHAIEQHPSISSYYYWRGIRLCGQMRYDAAISDFERALELNPDEEWHEYWLADALWRAGRDEEARKIYESMTTEGRLQVNRHQARFYYRIKEYDNFLKHLRAALDEERGALDVVRFVSDHSLAPVFDENQAHQYLDAIDRAVELNNRSSESLVTRASILSEFGEWERARADLDAVVAAEDAAYYPLYQASLLSAAGHDMPHYEKLCLKMLEAFADSDAPNEAHFAAWTCALAPDVLEDYAPAVKLARHAVEKEPGNKQYLTGLGAILMRSGHYDEAKIELEKALAASDSPNTSTSYVRYFLAMTEHKLGNEQAAKDQLETANKSADEELAGSTVWNRKLTIELSRKEAETLIGNAEASPDADSPDPTPVPQTSDK